MARWDTTALLASIRRRARITNSQASGYDNASLLEMANEELFSKLGADLVRLRREWFAKVRDVTLTVGTNTYRFWTRAVMAGARDVGIVSGGVFRELAYMAPEEMGGKDPTTRGSPTHYTVRGTDVVLYPTPNIADTLRVTYTRRMSALVLPSAAGVVSSVNNNPGGPTSLVMAVTAASLGITTSTPVDLVMSVPPFDSLGDSGTPTAIISSSLQFVVGFIPSEMLAVADGGAATPAYVCLAGESPVIQAPPEVFALLAQRVAASLVRPGRDPMIYQAVRDELDSLEASVFGVADRRVESDAQTVGAGTWA